MDAQTILEIKPALTAYLHEFDGCFANVRSQRHLATYVAGQLSDLPRKSLEPMAARPSAQYRDHRRDQLRQEGQPDGLCSATALWDGGQNGELRGQRTLSTTAQSHFLYKSVFGPHRCPVFVVS
jgi:hypothetical protein